MASGFNAIMNINNEAAAPMEPYIEIIEQPQSRIPFRYIVEGRASNLVGENNTDEIRSYPKIEIKNYNGSATVYVSCVSKDLPYRPHPHFIIGQNCQDGVCKIQLNRSSSEGLRIMFSQLKIQRTKKDDIEEALRVRERNQVDPFNTGFHHQAESFDPHSVRLCFQAFLHNGAPLNPVVSQPIYNKRTMTDLRICRMDKHSAKCTGGDIVFLLCDKVVKDDIEIRFFQEDGRDHLLWEGFGDFTPDDVHRQSAIVFRVPAYFNQNIVNPVIVSIQLRRPSDNEISDPICFQYIPVNTDPHGINRKKQKCKDLRELFFINPNLSTTVKKRLPSRSDLSSLNAVSPRCLQTRSDLSASSTVTQTCLQSRPELSFSSAVSSRCLQTRSDLPASCTGLQSRPDPPAVNFVTQTHLPRRSDLSASSTVTQTCLQSRPDLPAFNAIIEKSHQNELVNKSITEGDNYSTTYGDVSLPRSKTLCTCSFQPPPKTKSPIDPLHRNPVQTAFQSNQILHNKSVSHIEHNLLESNNPSISEMIVHQSTNDLPCFSNFNYENNYSLLESNNPSIPEMIVHQSTNDLPSFPNINYENNYSDQETVHDITTSIEMEDRIDFQKLFEDYGYPFSPT